MQTVKVTRLQRLWRLAYRKREPGKCVVCGCTMTNPCWHPKYGYCWWYDKNETVCSHCCSTEIFTDPSTVHCVNG